MRISNVNIKLTVTNLTYVIRAATNRQPKWRHKQSFCIFRL